MAHTGLCLRAGRGDTVTGVGDTKPAVSASRPQLNEGSHSELEMLRSRRWVKMSNLKDVAMIG